MPPEKPSPPSRSGWIRPDQLRACEEAARRDQNHVRGVQSDADETRPENTQQLPIMEKQKEARAAGRKLMRHAHLSTMDDYGSPPMENRRQANSVVVRKILMRRSSP